MLKFNKFINPPQIILGILFGFFIGGILIFAIRANKEIISSFTETNPNLVKSSHKKDSVYQENVEDSLWEDIKDDGFEIDMTKLDIVLIKRTIHDGSKATYVLYEDKTSDYFMCSKATHDKLIEQFNNLKKKREIGY